MISMNKKPVDPIFVLILYIIIAIGACIGILHIAETKTQKAVGCTVAALAILTPAVGLYIYDKKAQRRAEKPGIEDDSYFDSIEWREKYLKYVMRSPFETPGHKGMKHDLLRRYKRPLFVILIIIMLLSIAAIVIAAIAEYLDRGTVAALISALTLIIPSIAALRFCIIRLTACPVYEWLKALSPDDLAVIEESYMNGKIVSYKGNGINLGSTHIIIYDEASICAIENICVDSVTRNVVRNKEYETRQYFKEKYYAMVSFTHSGVHNIIPVELNEFQVEMVIEEFERCRLYSPG